MPDLSRIKVRDGLLRTMRGFFPHCPRSVPVKFPAFFDQVPTLRVRDALAAFLGAADDGLLEYGYADAVKLAGHSCPTVASAYVLGCRALAALYPDSLPERGGVRLAFASRLEDGVTGVTASVLTLLTGAAQDGGFKGIGGRFARRGLQDFGHELPLSVRVTRIDTGAAVNVASDLSHVPAHPDTALLLGRCVRGEADDVERQRFAALWQDRVARVLLQHWNDDVVFSVRAVG